jgi:integrase
MKSTDKSARKKMNRTLSYLGKPIDREETIADDRRGATRIAGPYYDANVDAYRLVVFDGGKRKSVSAKSRDEALQLKDELQRTLQQCDRTIGAAVEEFLEHKVRQGLKSRTVHIMEYKLKYFLPLQEPLSTYTAEQAQALYEAETVKISRYGRPMRVQTHHTLLKISKHFFRWAIDRKYIRASPFERVKPIGKPHAGKDQLRIDEGRQITQVLLSACEQNEQGAIAALTQLVLGLRSSEVLLRQVRDLDDQGAILWIPSGKTRNARRRLEVPEMLRPYLLRLTAGHPPDRLIFGAHRQEPYKPVWLWKQVKKYCRRAHVPRVCPHSLRGLHSSLAVAAGCTSSAVASALGHGSFAVTAKHYVNPDALKNSSVRRVTEVLGSPKAASLAELLERLGSLTEEERAIVLASLGAATKS